LVALLTAERHAARRARRIANGDGVGLISVTARGGENRSNPTTGDAESSIRVAATSWVGTIPTTLWINDGALSLSGLALPAFRPGTQWVVRVQNADAA
jgi:hypothetical protein